VTGRRGMSLVELVVVIALLAVMAAAVAPALPPVAHRTGNPGAELLGVLREARRMAIERQREVSVVVDFAKGAFWVVSSGDSVAPPDGRPLSGAALSRSPAAEPRVEFRFDRSGAAVGQSFTLVESGTSVVVGVEPWSGEPYSRRGSAVVP
jgi:prepilin-type N-terminal cleavage/methylation domain-containing protein